MSYFDSKHVLHFSELSFTTFMLINVVLKRQRVKKAKDFILFSINDK